MSLRNSSLLKAVEYGRGARVNRLLNDSLADVNSVDELGKSAIFRAVENGFLNVAKSLIENGADVNARFNGRSLIHIAIGIDDTKMVRLLLANGVNLKNKSLLMTPYDYAMQLNNRVIGKMIVDHVLSENEKLKLDDCIICFEPRKEIFSLNCGHAKLCETCCLKIMSENFPKCPLCRMEVTNYLKVLF